MGEQWSYRGDGTVGRADAGASGGEHDRRGGGCLVRVRLLAEQLVEVGGDVGVSDDRGVRHCQPPPTQPTDQDGAGAVGVLTGGGAGGRDDDECGTHRTSQSPDLPPDFARTRMSSITACLSTALIMS